MAGDTLGAAKEMFFLYDGSRFYMSRDGREAEYLDFEVPKSTEREWIEELTAVKLALLGSTGNYWSLNFLVGHRIDGHLTEVIAAKPLGALWQRTAYLEYVLRYVEVCRETSDQATVDRALDVVIAEGNKLIRSCRSDRTRARVGEVISSAQRQR